MFSLLLIFFFLYSVKCFYIWLRRCQAKFCSNGNAMTVASLFKWLRFDATTRVIYANTTNTIGSLLLANELESGVVRCEVRCYR